MGSETRKGVGYPSYPGLHPQEAVGESSPVQVGQQGVKVGGVLGFGPHLGQKGVEPAPAGLALRAPSCPGHSSWGGLEAET